MKLAEKYFDELLSEIENAKSDDSLIIVEGKKDRIALENLGLKNIFVLNETSKSICEKIEEISGKAKEVVIMTDIDKEGKKIYFLMKKAFSQMNVRINNRIRELLIKLKISHVEGLDSFICNHQSKNSCPTPS